MATVGEVDILFVSRGRGRGHAIPDLAIHRELSARRPGLTAVFCSYGTGALTIRRAGKDLLDLGLDDLELPSRIQIEVGRLLKTLSPRIVVCHEEFVAVPVAKIFDIPVIFLTHWFYPSTHFMTEAIAHSDSIGFLGQRGDMIEPSNLAGKVCYLCPVLRHFRYFPEDRDALRKELGIAADEKVIGVFPGSVFPGRWAEEMAGWKRMILDAFEAAAIDRKRLLLVDWTDSGTPIASRSKDEFQPIRAMKHPHPEALMIASDVAISTGSYSFGLELAAVRLPTIALSLGLNSIDDHFSRSQENTHFVYYKEATVERVARMLQELSMRVDESGLNGDMRGAGAAHVAEFILGRMESLT